MPSNSKSQQSVAGMALAYKRGTIAWDDMRKSAQNMAMSMSVKQLEEFASGSTKGKPKHVKK